jgi:hypothetical protein
VYRRQELLRVKVGGKVISSYVLTVGIIISKLHSYSCIIRTHNCRIVTQVIDTFVSQQILRLRYGFSDRGFVRDVQLYYMQPALMESVGERSQGRRSLRVSARRKHDIRRILRQLTDEL